MSEQNCVVCGEPVTFSHAEGDCHDGCRLAHYDRLRLIVADIKRHVDHAEIGDLAFIRRRIEMMLKGASRE